jgi:hypothetical protein
MYACFQKLLHVDNCHSILLGSEIASDLYAGFSSVRSISTRVGQMAPGKNPNLWFLGPFDP